MRRITQLPALVIAAGALAALGACSPDAVVTTEDVPTAGVRFINAVPDTGGSAGLDMRFVDIVENNAQFKVPFRNNVVTSNGIPGSTMIEYKNTRAGSRHFRIFLSDTLQAVAQVVLKDTTITIEGGKKYTVLLWGNARPSSGAPAMRLTVTEDNPPDPGTAIALRVINTTGAPIDVRQYLATAALPAAASWASVGALSASAYANVPVGTYRFNVQPTGGGASLFTDATALPGTPATVDIDAIPGTTVGGSAITAIVFPRSVAGSKAPQAAAFAVPAISFMWDRRPPRACSPLC
jgi:hypothetical protein